MGRWVQWCLLPLRHRHLGHTKSRDVEKQFGWALSQNGRGVAGSEILSGVVPMSVAHMARQSGFPLGDGQHVG